MRKENTVVKLTMTYGLYLGAATSLVVLVLHAAGNVHYPMDTIGLINAVITSVAMFYYGRKYRDVFMEGQLLYRQALGFTVLLTVFSSIIFAFFSYWYFSLIAPDAILHFLKQVEQMYAEQGQFTDEQIASFMELYRASVNPTSMAFVAGFNQTFIGVLMALVISVFLRTPMSFYNNQKY